MPSAACVCCYTVPSWKAKAAIEEADEGEAALAANLSKCCFVLLTLVHCFSGKGLVQQGQRADQAQS